MSPASSRHWASINEASFVGGMQFLFWVCKVFGRWPFRVVLYPVLLWYVASKPAARRASRDYLDRVGVRTAVPAGLMGVLRHFACFAETILDKMLLWGGLFKTGTVQVHGEAPLREMIAQRRGALLVCSHLGNLDLCRVLAQKVPDLRLTVLVHTRHARAFNAMLAKLDPRSGLDLLQVTEISAATAIMLAERVARGEFVVIAGDRVPVMAGATSRVALADFLGSPAAFPIGPYVMASVLDCPLYALFARREAGHYALYFELLEESVRLPRKERAAALNTLAARFAARLEHHCVRSPLEWFNFFDFWALPDLDRAHATQ
jgi:predicted LPLAT superfamily acyltransferase